MDIMKDFKRIYITLIKDEKERRITELEMDNRELDEKFETLQKCITKITKWHDELSDLSVHEKFEQQRKELHDKILENHKTFEVQILVDGYIEIRETFIRIKGELMKTYWIVEFPEPKFDTLKEALVYYWDNISEEEYITSIKDEKERRITELEMDNRELDEKIETLQKRITKITKWHDELSDLSVHEKFEQQRKELHDKILENHKTFEVISKFAKRL